jgi:hypothetical protein
MSYLVTGRRRNDGWPFAGEVSAGSGEEAAALVRRWDIEPEFIQHLATGRVEFRALEATEGDEGDGDLPLTDVVRPDPTGGLFTRPRQATPA